MDEKTEPASAVERRLNAVRTVSDLMNNPEVDHIDVRVFVDSSSYEDKEEALDAVVLALQSHPALAPMISAYQLVKDGFGNLTPDLDGGPIA